MTYEIRFYLRQREELFQQFSAHSHVSKQGLPPRLV
jgi:hypothetical protein